MPSALSFAVGQTTDIIQPIRAIVVSVGTVFVSTGDEVLGIVGEGETLTLDSVAAVHLHAPNGASFSVTYADEPEAEPAPKRKAATKTKTPAQKGAPRKSAAKRKSSSRGDSSKSNSTGSLEARTREELRKLAKKRNVTGFSSMSKDKLVKALRS
jgi:pyruvate/2-oxoglutarate dehydrogenase complex dihydrolipoamide acyltransferase (E2) component